MLRRDEPTLFTLDRSVQQVQRDLESLRYQLNGKSISPSRQGPRGSGKLFASTGRGRLQARAAMRTSDFLEAQSSNRYVISAVEPLELTEAFWFPDATQALPVTGYSFIRIYEHDPLSGKLVTEGRLLGDLEGKPKTAGEQAASRRLLSLSAPGKYRRGKVQCRRAGQRSHYRGGAVAPGQRHPLLQVAQLMMLLLAENIAYSVAIIASLECLWFAWLEGYRL
jgi:hypothetical protein